MNGDVAGVAVALAASLLYASAVGAQALEARRVHVRHALHFSLLERLVRRPLWLAGATAGLLGWVLQATALSFAPLTLVEPTLAASLVFLLAIGAFALHERVGGREVSAVFAIAVGVAGLAVVAPAHSTQHQGGARLVVVILGLAAIVAAPYALPGRVGSSTTLIAVSAGVAYAIVALATKFLSDDLSSSDWPGSAAWLVAVGAIAVAGVLSEMTALQRRPVIRVAPIVFGLTVSLPVALAPALAGEAWSVSLLGKTLLVALLAVVLAGVVALVRSPTVGSLLGSGTAEPTGNA